MTILLELLVRSERARVHVKALNALRGLDPAALAQHAGDVVNKLEDTSHVVRLAAVQTLAKLEPAALAQHADAVTARLEDVNENVRMHALLTLRELEPVTLAQHANAVIGRLEDSVMQVRCSALGTLGKLNPAVLAQHAGAVVGKLDDSHGGVRGQAWKTLSKLNWAALAQHADTVVARLEDSSGFVREHAFETLRKLPRFVTRSVDFSSSNSYNERGEHYATLAAAYAGLCRELAEAARRSVTAAIGAAWPALRGPNPPQMDVLALRSRLMGRLAWYRCRLRLRVRRTALYWYALPYRPSGPGHARDVEAWGQMRVE